MYLWTLRHSHAHSGPARDDAGWTVGCVQTLTLSPQPAGTGGPLRIVFTSGPGRYVPGGAPFGSGDVGYVRGASLNLHEPGAVRALLDAAADRGWLPGPGASRAVEVDGWALLTNRSGITRIQVGAPVALAPASALVSASVRLRVPVAVRRARGR